MNIRIQRGACDTEVRKKKNTKKLNPVSMQSVQDPFPTEVNWLAEHAEDIAMPLPFFKT